MTLETQHGIVLHGWYIPHPQARRTVLFLDPGFPVNALGPDSELKREIAVKAWFAWWWRRGERRFTEKAEGEDLLEEMIVPTDRDKRQMEADRRKAGGG